MENSNNSAPSAPVADTANASADATQGTEGTENKAATPEKLLKKYKLKVDGQDVEEEIDLNDEETVKRHLQMSKAAQKRMSETAAIKKQAEQFISMLRNDPVKLLSNPDLGIDFRKVAEEYLSKQLEIESLSPEQRKYREMEEQIRKHDEDKKRLTEETQSKQRTELEKHYAQDYDKKITEALSSSGLPKTAKTVKRMAELLHQNLKHGFDFEPKQLVEMVRKDYLNEIKELFGASDGDTLLKILGDDTANKIRKADLARLKTAQPSFSKKEDNPTPKDKPTKRMSTEEWMAEVRRRANS